MPGAAPVVDNDLVCVLGFRLPTARGEQTRSDGETNNVRGSIHTQLATRKVNLTFVGVWVIFFDVLPVAK